MQFTTNVLSRRALGLAMTLAVVLGACGADTESTEAGVTLPAASDTPSQDSGVGVVATVSGGQIDFGDLAGKDTLLWFWAPW